MSMAPKFTDLEQMTDAQIRELYDRTAETTVVGLNFYLDELRRRDSERTIRASNDLARKAFWLGVINGVFALGATVTAYTVLRGGNVHARQLQAVASTLRRSASNFSS